MSIGSRQPPLPFPVERVACVLGKSDRHVELRLRQQRLGTEVRCVYHRNVLWTELVKYGPDRCNEVQHAIDNARAAWEAKGCRCECGGAVERERPTMA